MRFYIRFALLASSFALLALGCSTTPEKPAPTSPRPLPQTVLMKSPQTPANAQVPRKTIKKDAFAVVARPGSLTVNGVPVENQQALTELLASHDGPLVTLSVHRCVDAESAKNLLTKIQSLTDIPIAYNAIGGYTDEGCKSK